MSNPFNLDAPIDQSPSRQLTESETTELRRLASHFPYRIVFGAKRAGEFQMHAKHDRRLLNRMAKDGWAIWKVG